MSLRTVLIIFLALICGGVGAYGFYIWSQGISPLSSDSQAADEKVTIVVARVPIQRGTLIKEEMLATVKKTKTADWEKDPPPFLLHTTKDAEGLLATTDFGQGEWIFKNKLSKDKGAVNMAAMIPAVGLRSYPIKGTDIASLGAGFVQPGDHVDVLLTLPPLDAKDDSGGTTFPLVQDAEVLAVNWEVNLPASEKVSAINKGMVQSVTLLVKPVEAQLLALGTEKGRMSLALRRKDDKEITNIPSSQMRKVFESLAKGRSLTEKSTAAGTPPPMSEQVDPPDVDTKVTQPPHVIIFKGGTQSKDYSPTEAPERKK